MEHTLDMPLTRTRRKLTHLSAVPQVVGQAWCSRRYNSRHVIRCLHSTTGGLRHWCSSSQITRNTSIEMSRFAGVFLLLCLHAGFAHDRHTVFDEESQQDLRFSGMDCSFGRSSNLLEKVINTCPGILDPSYKSYCCYDIHNDKSYCCDAEEFALKTGLGIIVPVIITAAIVITLIVCCISCLCCSCCPWYRRRHRGTVYGKVQAPNVVHVVQTPANLPPSYVSQDHAQNHYPTNPAGFPQHPPPQYTSEVYAKQAPYNPAYPPQ